jgi:quercetin dioxygenase-like cupin family protein
MKTLVGQPAKFFSAGIVLASLMLLPLTDGWAQQPGVSRTILQKADISAPGREVVQVRAELDAGVGTGKHTHPGEEVGYVLDGMLVYAVEGKPPVTIKAGDHFFAPAGTVHEGKSTGNGKAKVLITYIVEKGKPLTTPVK